MADSVSPSRENPLIEAELLVKVDGDVENISAETFFKATKGLYDVVKDVDRALNEGRAAIKWEIVGMKKASASLTYGAVTVVNSPNLNGKAVRDVFVDGLRSIQNRTHVKPHGFSDKALKKLRSVIAKLPPHENVLQVGPNLEGAVRLSMDAVAQIDEWMEVTYHSTGSIEGRLENVLTHDNKNNCAIFDRDNRKITCIFGKDLKMQVKDGLYDRVAVKGLISYRADRTPVAIRAKKILPLPEEKDMPPLRSLMGTWELEQNSEDYVEGLHGE